MTNKDLHDRRFYHAKEEAEFAEKADVGTPQTRDPAYRLAFQDTEFLLREELRPVRFQLELLKPEMLLDEAGIGSTLVMYGSARIPEPDKADALIEAAVDDESRKIAERLKEKAKYYDEARELAGQLEDSWLFEVSTEDAEWEEYQTLYKQNAYDLFVLGWYPDFLDADNYLSPFLRDGGFYQNNYSSQEVNSLLDEELGETDEATREEQIGELQDIVAEDVPLIPSWNGQNVAVAVPEMEGVEGSLDPTYIFRLWEISKG